MPCLINAPIKTTAINPKTVPTTSPILMSNESILAASGSQYVLVEGKIYRGDALVATVQGDGSLDYAPDMARYRAPVVKFLKGLEATEPLAPAKESEPVAEKLEEPIAAPSEVVPEPLNEAVPVIDSPEVFGRAFEAIKRTERVVEPENIKNGEGSAARAVLCPSPAPPQDYRGDKTPAFVDWLWAHKPLEALSRYENRGALPGKSYEERRAALALAV